MPLGKSHFPFLLFLLKLKRLLIKLEHGKPRILFFLFTGTSTRVEVLSAVRAQPLTVGRTQDLRRQREDKRLPYLWGQVERLGPPIRIQQNLKVFLARDLLASKEIKIAELGLN